MRDASIAVFIANTEGKRRTLLGVTKQETYNTAGEEHTQKKKMRQTVW
jgi:hypothetical protein